MEMKELGSRPISDESPAGRDVRYEPQFEALSEEIAKIGSPTAGSAVDWDNVITLSSGILEKQSKHLQAASYLSYALLKRDGIEGLAVGVHILNDLCLNFWDTLFPPKKRMKGRRGIISWWQEKVADFVASAESVTWGKEKRDALLGDLDSLDEFLGENMEEAPLLKPLKRSVESLIAEEKQAEPEPDPEPAAESKTPEPETSESQKAASSSPASAAPARAPAEKEVSDSDADPADICRQGLNLLARSISGLRQNNFFDPVAYRLNRVAAWTPIDEVPSATGGKTMLPPPDEQIISALSGLYESAKWEELADACESKVRQYLFWLDLSRYVAESMENLGHEEVRDVIEAETALFVKRLSGIEKMAFSDGTPFADPETKEWLKGLSGKSSGKGGSAGPESGGGIRQKVEKESLQAHQLVREKKADEAVALFRQNLAGSFSGREKFLRKTALCRLLISTKQNRIAGSYINDLLADMDKYGLETWEPEIAVEALSVVLTGLRLQKSERNSETAEAVIDRISVLDPVKALEIL
ncbi:MAG: type VI secretion system protein TssA [Thermodesulfobacteriota bacterium]